MEYSGKQQVEVMVETGKCYLTIKSSINAIAKPWSTNYKSLLQYPLLMICPYCLYSFNTHPTSTHFAFYNPTIKYDFQFPEGTCSYLILSLAYLNSSYPLTSNWNTMTLVKFPDISLSPRDFLFLMLSLNFVQNSLMSHTRSWYYLSPACNYPESRNLLVVLSFFAHGTQECWLNESVYECKRGFESQMAWLIRIAN